VRICAVVNHFLPIRNRGKPAICWGIPPAKLAKSTLAFLALPFAAMRCSRRLSLWRFSGVPIPWLLLAGTGERGGIRAADRPLELALPDCQKAAQSRLITFQSVTQCRSSCLAR
jgi:hypothetical protein